MSWPHYFDSQTAFSRFVVPTFESVEENLECDHSNERYWAVLSRGAVNFFIYPERELKNIAHIRNRALQRG